MFQIRLLTREQHGTPGKLMSIGKLVSQLVAHLHVTLVHTTVAH